MVAYNFLSGGSPARTGHWSRIRTRLAPDIVLAQECRAPQESPGERFRAGATDTLLWAPAAPRRWGSAVLLRGQPATSLTIPEFAGWVVGAELSGTELVAPPVRCGSSASTARWAARATSGPCTRSWTGSPRCAPART